MAYGVLPEGFVVKPLSQIKADVIARLVQSSEVGPAQDYSDTAPLGQIIGSLGSEAAELWELGQSIHSSGDPEGALGVPLDQLLALTGSERPGARASRCEGVVLTLEPGAVVPAGSVASVAGRPDITYTLLVDVENDGGVEADIDVDVDGAPVVFTCTETGPIATNAETLTVIDTAVTGWLAVTNPEDAIPGRNVAGDIEYRQRWADERARSGSTTVAAIRAALLDTETNPELETVEKVLVLENKKDYFDANGLPPHSIEAIIDDGPTPSVDDDLIAQIIWERGAAGGIDTHGNQSGTATDSEGVEQVIKYSRVSRQEIYITITVTRGSRYPVDGAEKVATALVTAGNGYDVSDDVIALYIKSQALTVAGVTDVTAFAIGLTPTPTEEVNIPMGYRERATFSTTRVTVTEA